MSDFNDIVFRKAVFSWESVLLNNPI